MPGYVETLYAYAAEAEFAKRIAAGSWCADNPALSIQTEESKSRSYEIARRRSSLIASHIAMRKNLIEGAPGGDSSFLTMTT